MDTEVYFIIEKSRAERGKMVIYLENFLFTLKQEIHPFDHSNSINCTSTQSPSARIDIKTAIALSLHKK